MKKLVIIDTFGFFFRAFYALPPLKSKDGFPTGLLTGFVNLLSSIINAHEADYIAFALESKEGSFRKDMDASYKANRQEAPEELKMQLPVAISWVEKMGFKNISVAGYEADDVIATLAEEAKKEGIAVTIISHDKDLYQLIDDTTILFDPIKKVPVNREGCLQKYGVAPEHFIDYQAIVGDSSDNVPGVKGIGAKGAQKLIEQYQNLENIYANIDAVEPKRTRELLLEGRESAFQSRELVRLVRSIEGINDFSGMGFPSGNPLEILSEEFAKYGMNNALKKTTPKVQASIDFGEEEKAVIPAKKEGEFRFSFEILDNTPALFAAVEKAANAPYIALDTETDSLDTKEAHIVGFSFCFEAGKGYYVPIAHNYLGVGEQVGLEDVKEAIAMLLKRPLVGHNLKFDLSLLRHVFGFEDFDVYSDTMLLAWLVDPESPVGLDACMARYFNYSMQSFKETVKKGENFSAVNIESAAEYASEDAAATFSLYEKLNRILEMQKPELKTELQEVEIPFLFVLRRMEEEGIKVDRLYFEELLKEIDGKIGEITERIYALSNSRFNINSTQQLAKVLFEGLGLKSKKKTKTGYSTDEKTLDSLRDEHEVIPVLLEYRELFKLKSTYIEPLLKLSALNQSHRIYTSFLQTGTATGRLSSKNPNLQNIPVKTELGRRIRRGFVAREGFKLLSLDYSQIELRLLAHFSQDAALLRAFRDDKDIHMETSIKIFGEEEAREKRNIAKSINFGLIYGMGARKLGETLHIPQNTAKSYIESYFRSFPTVKDFIASTEESILKNGYIETLLGRRRYFSFQGAAEYQKAGYLREGVNTLFQGSAADLIKLSMIRIDALLKNHKSKMLLQVHDELIFEISEDELAHLPQELQNIMEIIHPLSVPLVCGASIGDNWGELK